MKKKSISTVDDPLSKYCEEQSFLTETGTTCTKASVVCDCPGFSGTVFLQYKMRTMLAVTEALCLYSKLYEI